MLSCLFVAALTLFHDSAFTLFHVVLLHVLVEEGPKYLHTQKKNSPHALYSMT